MGTMQRISKESSADIRAKNNTQHDDRTERKKSYTNAAEELMRAFGIK